MGADGLRRRAAPGLRLSGPSGGGDPGRPRRILHGRRSGRPLRPARRTLLETLLPKLAVPLAPGSGPLDPRGLFPFPCRAIALEIGFGAGEHLAAQARAAPEVGFIGCEPFINGVASLLALIDSGGLRNIRIVRDDARLLLDRLAGDSVDRAYILFPDPWPKTRHHKRRIVAGEPLAHLARALRAGAELRIATDDPGYKSWILERVLASGAFDWCAEGPADWRVRPADWPATRYEAKARAAGRSPAFFRFRRREKNA